RSIRANPPVSPSSSRIVIGMAKLTCCRQAILLNAIYFKAQWASKFAPLTENGTFNLSLSQSVDVPMMRQITQATLVPRQNYRAIRLPYEIAYLAMIIVLPNEMQGLAEVTGRLDSNELSELMQGLELTAAAKRVDLSLPRYKISFETGLEPLFEQLGM